MVSIIQDMSSAAFIIYYFNKMSKRERFFKTKYEKGSQFYKYTNMYIPYSVE